MANKKSIEMIEENYDITITDTNVIILDVDTDEEALEIHNSFKHKFVKLKSLIVDDEVYENIELNKPRKERKIKEDGTIEVL